MTEHPSPDAAAVPAVPGSLHFVGNATLLLRYRELTLLTDPNFLHRGELAYLGHGLVSRRLTEPALSVHQLPPLDGIVLSHLHGDHWDRRARRGLDRDTQIITTRHAAKRLQWQGFGRATGLQTWSAQDIVGTDTRVRVTSVPARHGPPVASRLLPPVMGSILEFSPLGGPVEYRIYITGDTVLYRGLADIREQFPDIDLAVLHLGGTTLPGGLVVTMDGAQGAALLDLIEPRQAIPVHYDDYSVFASPLADFVAEVAHRDQHTRVVHIPRGRHLPFGPTRPPATGLGGRANDR